MSSSSSALELLSETKCFGGVVRRYQHQSQQLGCAMKFHVFLPATATAAASAPVLYFLAGLTCTDETFFFKACALEQAAKHGIALVAPDTSPRGADVPSDPDNSWDFGQGAGFYVDATQAPYSKNYRMYSYIVQELPEVISSSAALGGSIDTARSSIFGHSMGGFGALQIYLKNQNLYKSCSAFAPISHPSDAACAWGQKALPRYFGSSDADKQTTWRSYDPTLLMKDTGDKLDKVPILVDQGTADKFLAQQQLQPEAFVEACREKNYPLIYRQQEGYDHGYYFIQSFIKDHIEHHAKFLFA